MSATAWRSQLRSMRTDEANNLISIPAEISAYTSSGTLQRTALRRPSFASYRPFNGIVHRHLSTGGGDGISGSSSTSRGRDILESAAATAKWKRGQHRKIEDKFTPDAASGGKSASAAVEPPIIESDDDVQPMWKEMESRVTRRRSLTLEQRGGVSGRRNVRKSDEDVWLEAGVYDTTCGGDDDDRNSKGGNDSGDCGRKDR